MNRQARFSCAILALLVTMTASASGPGKPLRVGWAVGQVVDEQGKVIGPSIQHTRNGGRKWIEQADISRWPGYAATDVSAVDKRTAWVALEGPGELGAILHTRNGGVNWVAQTLPDGVGIIKQVKGLSHREAWAASLGGTVLHTTDKGETWNIVDTSPIPIVQVNRMDVIGYVDPRDDTRPAKDKLMSNANIWIADEIGEDDGQLGMIHSLYNGDIWRQEYIPCETPPCRVHMVSAFSPRVAWAAAWYDGTLYRTADGGENWKNVGHAGNNDIDDMCAPSEDTLWAVQYQGRAGGVIYHARLLGDGTSEVASFNPSPGYAYEGLTCVDDQTAVAVGYQAPGQSPGLIVSTTDGGTTWRSVIIDNVMFWKTSFVGARR
jgi:photosystem II stability/assembly factor-like uncharacterized protein